MVCNSRREYCRACAWRSMPGCTSARPPQQCPKQPRFSRCLGSTLLYPTLWRNRKNRQTNTNRTGLATSFSNSTYSMVGTSTICSCHVLGERLVARKSRTIIRRDFRDNPQRNNHHVEKHRSTSAPRMLQLGSWPVRSHREPACKTQ